MEGCAAFMTPLTSATAGRPSLAEATGDRTRRVQNRAVHGQRSDPASFPATRVRVRRPLGFRTGHHNNQKPITTTREEGSSLSCSVRREGLSAPPPPPSRSTEASGRGGLRDLVLMSGSFVLADTCVSGRWPRSRIPVSSNPLPRLACCSCFSDSRGNL